MPIANDTLAWRRDLPHLEKSGKTLFITFCTRDRRFLETSDRAIVIATVVAGHLSEFFLHCCVVMPDHVHLVFTLYEHVTLPRVTQQLKGVSAHRIGRGTIWQHESFDRILRSSEDRRRKCEYVCMNPVRAGLVDYVDDYPWVWRSWIEGEKVAPARAPAPH